MEEVEEAEEVEVEEVEEEVEVCFSRYQARHSRSRPDIICYL